MNFEPHRLTRLLKPKHVAIVGASEQGARSRNAIEAMSAKGIDLHLINRRGEQVFGMQTHTSLTALAEAGIIPDAAVVFTNGSTAVEVVREAASLGVGGLIVNAAGFAEAGDEGRTLQERLVQAAGSTPVIGPNCNGVIAPALGLHMAGSPTNLPLRSGKVAFVTHSGATMLPLAYAGVERLFGFSYLVSTGNEAVVDMAEVIDFLATDGDTAAISLLIETIRNPQAFWAAVEKALTAGKPVIALKNGRSARGKAIASSHTGAVAGEAWVYEAVLRQHGVIVASDLVDLADRLVIFGQVPRERWNAAEGVAIQALSGGWVTMASDICAEEGIDLPDLADLREELRRTIPEVSVANPLDLTGAAMVEPGVARGAFDTVASSDEVDTIILHAMMSEASERGVRMATAAALDYEGEKLVIVSSVEGGSSAGYMQEHVDKGIAVARGTRATVRAVRSMADFVEFSQRSRSDMQDAPPMPVPTDVIDNHDVGPMLSFAATMRLLETAGIPVAPFLVVANDEPILAQVPFSGPYVVKLADVPHRSDIGAVRLGVDQAGLPAVVDDLRRLAADLGEPAAVAIQPQCRITSELLIGIDGESELGAVVVTGLGGIFVEILKKLSARLAPFDTSEALRLVEEINLNGVLDGPRGSPAWPKERLAEILCAASRLAQSASPWLSSLDINPIGLTDQGIVAVDGLAILRPINERK